MKTTLVFLCVVVAVAFASRIPREDKYTTKYDNIDLDDILKNERLLANYIKCLMDKGNCTPDGTELKKVLPDALENACSKCNETQKKGAEKVIKYLIEHKPEQYKELAEKYDPKGVYKTKYEAELKRVAGDVKV